jgi:threonine dehydratase
MPELPAAADVAGAAQRLADVIHITPVMTSRTLDAASGRAVFLKCENFQRVGAFKFRGAYNAISRLSPECRSQGVVTHSSGNHAQGVALAAQLLGVPATIVMPADAPSIKRSATAGYGARIVTCAAAEREAISAQLVADEGLTLVHPYDDGDVIAGQGTAAWELLQAIGTLDILLVPVGGGGLISGSALAASALCPACRVIGVEPALADDAGRSYRSGEVVTLTEVPGTIADGLRTRFVGRRNLAIMRRHVADMITVPEEAIVAALRFAWQRLKIVIEPSAAVALAPLLTGALRAPGARVGVILSGGNVDMTTAIDRLWPELAGTEE